MARKTWLRSASVVEDDLPAGWCFFEDEREDALRVAACVCRAREVVAAGDHGDVSIEGMDFEIVEGKLTHLFLAGEISLVASKDVGEAVLDGLADEGGVGRVVVALHE